MVRSSIDNMPDDISRRQFNGYGLWLWHTGNEWSYKAGSATQRAGRAMAYCQRIVDAVELALTGKITASRADEEPQVFAQRILSRLNTLGDTQTKSLLSTSNAMPDIIVIDLEHHYLGNSRHDRKNLDFINEFVNLASRQFPQTEFAVTTYGKAQSYVDSGRGSELTFDVDYVIPQAYHGGFGELTKRLFIDQKLSVAAIAMKSWSELGKQAFPTLRMGGTRVLPAGMPIVRKGKLDGTPFTSGEPGHKFTTSWDLYIAKGPSIRSWWSDAILTRKVTDAKKLGYDVDKTNFSVMKDYYDRMKQLGYGPLTPTTVADALQRTVEVTPDGSIVVRELGDYALFQSSRYVSRPADMSNSAFLLLKSLGLAHATAQEKEGEIKEYVCDTCTNFDAGNFIAALSMLRREHLDVNEFAGKDYAQDLENKWLMVSNKSNDVLRKRSLTERALTEDATLGDEGYSFLMKPPEDLAKIIKELKEHEDLRSGSNVSFNFQGSITVSLIQETGEGYYSSSFVPLINNTVMKIQVDDFSVHHEEVPDGLEA
jgi:hypothetical protein